MTDLLEADRLEYYMNNPEKLARVIENENLYKSCIGCHNECKKFLDTRNRLMVGFGYQSDFELNGAVKLINSYQRGFGYNFEQCERSQEKMLELIKAEQCLSRYVILYQKYKSFLDSNFSCSIKNYYNRTFGFRKYPEAVDKILEKKGTMKLGFVTNSFTQFGTGFGSEKVIPKQNNSPNISNSEPGICPELNDNKNKKSRKE